MVSRWIDFVRLPVVAMTFPGHSQSHRSAVRLVILTGIFSLVGLFLALGAGAERGARFSKTCSMEMSCCVTRAHGDDCGHSQAEVRHDVPPGFRQALEVELEAACGCPAPASTLFSGNDGLITLLGDGIDRAFGEKIGFARDISRRITGSDLPFSSRGPPSNS